MATGRGAACCPTLTSVKRRCRHGWGQPLWGLWCAKGYLKARTGWGGGDKIAGGYFLWGAQTGRTERGGGLEANVEWVCGSVISRGFQTSGTGLSLPLKTSVKTLLSEGRIMAPEACRPAIGVDMVTWAEHTLKVYFVLRGRRRCVKGWFPSVGPE